jgi:hypothetical protein
LLVKPLTRPGTRRIPRSAWIAVLLAVPSSAWADDREEARRAYDQGTVAHKRGDYAEAATQFARADELAPSSIALRAALDEAVRARNCVLGAELLERSKRGPSDTPLSRSVGAAEGAFRGCAGRVVVHCPEGRACQATLDGKPMAPGKPTWSRVGQRTLLLQVDDRTLPPRQVEIKPDETLDIPVPVPEEPASPPPVPAPRSEGTAPIRGEAEPTPPSEPHPAPSPRSSVPTSRTEAPMPRPAGPADPPAGERPPSASGLSPVWFWIGVGGSALLGGATALSAVDTMDKHNQFVGNSCAEVANPPCSSLSTEGSSAQLRTNILIAGTAVVAVVTIVVGAAFTRWSTPGGRTAFRPGSGAATFEF